MEELTLHHTECADEFSKQMDRSVWDDFLKNSGESSIHLSWPAVHAALSSQTRQVRAGWWMNDEDEVHGIALCEDSEAISQSVDEFLDGTVLFKWAKSWLHRQGGFRFRVRVVGTPLASGPHGYRFFPEVNEWACLRELLSLPGMGHSDAPRTWVIKDRLCHHEWGDGFRLSGRSLWRKDWVDLEFDPVMRVDLKGKGTWGLYLDSMRTKARTKVKRVLSLSEGIELQALTADEIEENLDELYPLYMKVYGRAAFRLGCLQAEDLVLLKRDMGEDFQVWSSRWEGRLIGFHCGMCNGEEVEAYFVGFQPEYNKSHALYQRMLLEFIRWGIDRGCHSVNLGRTALDIKASLGAEPQRLVLHQRSTSPVMHLLARWAARASAPKQHMLKRAWKESPRGEGPASLHHEVVPSTGASIS